jgi:arsenate reductase (thioredoxin)
MRRAIRERNILFLCEDNACLSQMAEAVARHLGPPKIRIFSAGVKPTQIPAPVYKVMEELGISMSGQSSKGVDEVPLNEIDLVVSFGDAHNQCGRLPQKAKVERWPITNPGRVSGGGAGALSTLRSGRDEIDRRVFALFLDHWRNVA